LRSWNYNPHRRTDVLPLHPELVSLLPGMLAGMKRGQLLFPKLERKKTWLMVKKDLERVGIAYETEEGIADFHAAGRHTHTLQSYFGMEQRSPRLRNWPAIPT
jgi:hypothetical protein